MKRLTGLRWTSFAGVTLAARSIASSETRPSTTVLDADEHDGSGPPQPPAGWTLDVLAGTGRFIMKKELASRRISRGAAVGNSDPEPEGEGGLVFLQCNSDLGSRFNEGAPGSSKEQAHLSTLKPLPKFSKVRPASRYPELPCTFSALVFQPDAAVEQVAKRSATKPPLALEALISCRGSMMTIDSLMFHRSESTLDAVLDVESPKPSGATALRYEQYQGPTLHQRRLAEEVLFQSQSPSKLPIYLDAHYKRYESHPIHGGAGHTRHYKYGHVPVHTIEPELYDRMYLYLESLGVDDNLAAFVRRYANYNQVVERQEWTDTLKSLFTRRKQK